MAKRAYERLIEYARVHTASVEDAETTPSTQRQFDLAHLLEKELTALGVSDVYVDEHCYVYGKLPATAGLENKPCIGFLAHLDTIPDFSGENVDPRVIESYDGGDVVLGTSGRTLSPDAFPHLHALKGKTLIVTDGTTVLGADDKAGVAEIVTAAERLLSSSVPHGPVAIGFCPDEEVGHGASLLDLKRFGAELGYTVDGGGLGEIEYENFNAAGADVEFHGFNVHPGTAKNTMINASLVAMQFNAMLPAGDTPRETEGYEGFFHLTEMEGGTEKAKLSYIIRDHDAGGFEARKKLMVHAAQLLNDRYGEGTVTLKIREQYRNMLEQVKPRFEVVEKAEAAYRAMGVEPKAVPIRGGTDGAQLSYRGLPCPNLPTGSYAHHGPYEHAVAEDMDQVVELILGIVKEFTK
ncbi:MAG: peptidase T [Ruminococcaceae bacterium]|jgi:tripeptide aminopeptidase|nr:peptidase T [Oscillospiraceae bacterium]